MGRVRGNDHSPLSIIRFVEAAPIFPGGYHRGKVSFGAAACKNSEASLWHAGKGGKPFHRLVLGKDATGAFHPECTVNTGCRGHQIKHYSRTTGRSRHKRKVAAVVDRYTRFEQPVTKKLKTLFAADTRRSYGFADERTELSFFLWKSEHRFGVGDAVDGEFHHVHRHLHNVYIDVMHLCFIRDRSPQDQTCK